jgi:RNA polymerase sigma-70 factor, ECF subfamily
MINKIPESEVIRRVLEGERDLYRELVDRYQPMVFRICMGFIHNKEDADDLTQDVFIQSYLSLSRFKGNSSFSTWLFRIAVNISLNRVRTTSRNFLMLRLDTFFHTKKGLENQLIIPENENPESLLLRDEHREWLQKALNSLPVKQRTAFVLSKYEDLSQMEIAMIMNISEGAVESLIQRAKINLRAKLSASQKKNDDSP